MLRTQGESLVAKHNHLEKAMSISRAQKSPISIAAYTLNADAQADAKIMLQIAKTLQNHVQVQHSHWRDVSPKLACNFVSRVVGIGLFCPQCYRLCSCICSRTKVASGKSAHSKAKLAVTSRHEHILEVPNPLL
jgi:hypothetical protein